MVKIFQVDSFTKEPFKGNPAAICILDRMPSEQWMQSMAKEMNLSETAYLVSAGGPYDLRWFTPEVEVELCGHATLAAAHILWSEGYLNEQVQAMFRTRSGILTAVKDGDWIKMDFPLRPYEETKAPEGLLDCLKVEAKAVVSSLDNYLVEVESEAILQSLAPDFVELLKLDMHGLIVTAPGTGKYDFVSRFFAPSQGINEDPVTGSAHCTLAAYWSDKLGKSELSACQISERRGELKLAVVADEGRVFISGQAVTVLRGEVEGEK